MTAQRSIFEGGLPHSDLEKTRELLRIGAVRLDVLARRLGEGRLVDESSGATP